MRKEWLNFIPAFTTELSCNFRQSNGVDPTEMLKGGALLI